MSSSQLTTVQSSLSTGRVLLYTFCASVVAVIVPLYARGLFTFLHSYQAIVALLAALLAVDQSYGRSASGPEGASSGGGGGGPPRDPRQDLLLLAAVLALVLALPIYVLLYVFNAPTHKRAIVGTTAVIGVGISLYISYKRLKTMPERVAFVTGAALFPSGLLEALL